MELQDKELKIKLKKSEGSEPKRSYGCTTY